MVKYEVTVFTTDVADAVTFNDVFIKLVGTDGESDRIWLDRYKGALSFVRGAVSLKRPPLNESHSSSTSDY